MKNNDVAAAIHAKLMRIDWSKLPKSSPLVNVTVCVSGRTAVAKTCMNPGKPLNGKNVPLKRNIGVMNRKAG